MRKQLTIVILLFLLFAGCASIENLTSQQRSIGSGDVAVTLPNTLTVTGVDGKSIDAPSLVDGDYTLLLDEGEHLISLKYYENWDTPEESGNIFSSAVLSVKAKFKSSGVYSFHHSVVDSADTAEKFVNAPEIWLRDNGNRVDAVIGKEKQTIIEALVIGSLVENLEQGASDPVRGDKADHLMMLKEAWSNASEEERDAFWLWIRKETH